MFNILTVDNFQINLSCPCAGKLLHLSLSLSFSPSHPFFPSLCLSLPLSFPLYLSLPLCPPLSRSLPTSSSLSLSLFLSLSHPLGLSHSLSPSLPHSSLLLPGSLLSISPTLTRPLTLISLFLSPPDLTVKPYFLLQMKILKLKYLNKLRLIKILKNHIFAILVVVVIQNYDL